MGTAESDKELDCKKSKPITKRKISIDEKDVPVQKVPKVEADTEQSVQEKEDEEQVADAQKHEHAKRHKKRKRHYFNAIREQMEFYFGDANLSKDRYLKKLIIQDPFVPLEVFMTFNKMKTLAKSVEKIAKSLSNSELLELDEGSLKVRRKTNIPEERNVDEKTLYVESLPANATHDWVRQIFERFGPVTYVSLPKYAKSRKIKEFGFIEFEHEKSIAAAVQSFKEFNGVLKTEETDPAELSSVKSFIKEQNEQVKQEEKDMPPDDNKVKEVKPLKKRIKKENYSETEAGSATNTQTSDTEAEENVKEDEAKTGADIESKKKHRKKKKLKKKEGKGDEDLSAEAVYFELKILPKRDWKNLRNKYLNLQRKKVGELKRKAWLERQEQQQQQANEIIEDESAENEAKLCKTKIKAGMNMNFYGAGDDEATLKTSKKNPALERAPLFTFEPGLIVEVSLLEACTNLKEFKANMRQYTAVKYVDIKEGAMLAQLRLESAAAAQQFVSRMNSAEYSCKVLAGETETAYWQKIEKDREAKLNKQVKLPLKRGREKIKKLISQHIHFGDE